MKIAIVSYQGYDGAGVLHAHYFANTMVDQGHEVLLLLNGDVETASLLAEAPRYRLQEVAFRYGVLAPECLRAIRELAPEIVHLWTPRHLPARVGLEAWGASDARIVIHYEDDEEHILEHFCSNTRFCSDDLRLYRFFRRDTFDPQAFDSVTENLDHAFLRLTIEDPTTWAWIHPLVTPVAEKLADGYTAISPSYQRILRRRTPAPVRILYPGVDLEWFSPRPKPSELVEQLALEGRTVLLYSGSIAEIHDFTSVLHALPTVTGEHPEVLLLQVGHNYIPEETDRIVAELALADHVLFAGPVAHHSMPDYLALADAYIGTVRVDEFNGHRLPSKIPEYMAMGQPMLIMDHGVGHELEPGSEVIKVGDDSPQEVGRGLVQLLECKGSWDRMGERLRSRAMELFDWQRNTAGLVSFYREILESAPASAPDGLEPPERPFTLADIGCPHAVAPVAGGAAETRSPEPLKRKRIVPDLRDRPSRERMAAGNGGQEGSIPELRAEALRRVSSLQARTRQSRDFASHLASELAQTKEGYSEVSTYASDLETQIGQLTRHDAERSEYARHLEQQLREVRRAYSDQSEYASRLAAKIDLLKKIPLAERIWHLAHRSRK